MKLLWIPGGVAILGQLLGMLAFQLRNETLDTIGVFILVVGLVGLAITFLYILVREFNKGRRE